MTIRQRVRNFVKDVFNVKNNLIASVPERAYELSLRSSCDYAEKKMKESLLFFEPSELWDFTIQLLKATKPNNNVYFEFGVFKGRTINYFSKRLPENLFYGFDSFKGLQTDWKGWALPKGSFDMGGQKPIVNKNVKLIDGWFDESVPAFIQNNKIEKIGFIHIDSDTYESAKLIFDLLGDKMGKDTLILFDEYFGYRGWEIGEYKAFQEYVSRKNIEYRYLGFSREQVLVKIIS